MLTRGAGGHMRSRRERTCERFMPLPPVATGTGRASWSAFSTGFPQAASCLASSKTGQ
jgi:hypothetical protein